MKQNRILLVDDETNVIMALRRQLRKQPYEVFDAQSGDQALLAIKENGPFAVIVSDYRMPGLNGIEFLSRSQELCPDAARIILTGSNETEVAINAVNFSNIFRFLLKPIAPSALISAIAAGIEQHRLVTAERDLLAELSMMQKIDRELNTSLDIHQTMKITLDWAIRQSQADSGLIGKIRETDIQIMACQGYQNELDPYSVSLPLEVISEIQTVITLGNVFQAEGGGGRRLLKKAQSQAIIPIRWENQTIGILLLENQSPEPLPQKTIAFLTRLSDHASIAISNADLYAAARAANQAKSEFVSFVAHELKNPITSIGGFTELLISERVGEINDQQKSMLDFVRVGVKRLTALVADLSDISRIESGHMQLKLVPIPLMDLIKAIVGSQQPNLEMKNQTLHLAVPAELPLIQADRERITQVIINLVSNAIKYTQDGGKIILGAEVSPEASREVAHIWVKDNGIGISPADQMKVFQKFFRSSDFLATQSPGTGLGLNITKNLVELQGGKIWFESKLREGSTFHIIVPLAAE